MHHRLEIIMPPTNDVEAAIESIMKPFDENGHDEDGYTRHAFWDWYVIGGRWSGQKFLDGLDKAKLEEFNNWLTEQKVTVSGLKAGKDEISPATQIPKIDAKWNEMFPSANGELVACPLFKHAGDSLTGDILPLAQCKNVTAGAVIIAIPSYNFQTEKRDGPMEAALMLREDIWNGVTWQKTTWDGTLASALQEHAKRLENYKDEYREKAATKDDWLVVTVDYHS